MSHEPMTFGGLKIVICEDQITPKMQLSEDCPVTPDFRVEMNAWMREFFGFKRENIVPDGQTFVMEQRGEVYVNPRTYQSLRELYGTHAL